MKRAFTLVEVTLAVMVMATGLMSIIALFSLAFREGRQSAEDVNSAAFADAVMGRLVMAASATNLNWEAFAEIPSYPSRASELGWGAYLNGTVPVSDPGSIARNAFDAAMSAFGSAARGGGLDIPKLFPAEAGGDLKPGLLIMHDRGSAIIRISFRAVRNPAMLLSAPLYYTEVRFQGIPNTEGQ